MTVKLADLVTANNYFNHANHPSELVLQLHIIVLTIQTTYQQLLPLIQRILPLIPYETTCTINYLNHSYSSARKRI